MRESAGVRGSWTVSLTLRAPQAPMELCVRPKVVLQESQWPSRRCAVCLQLEKAQTNNARTALMLSTRAGHQGVSKEDLDQTCIARAQVSRSMATPRRK